VKAADEYSSTDWDKYYANPFPASRITRRMTVKKVVGCLRLLVGGGSIEIAEFGGGNSFIADRILTDFKVRRYVVWDTNARGLDLFQTRYSDNKMIEARLGDVREVAAEPEFDFVFSIGLIEHFDQEGTRRALESHFRICKPGGHVLVSFPTPTFLYRLIRGVATMTSTWNFPDERPLLFDEVLNVALKHGTLNYRSILWGIGLTQGYVVIQKT
jgi:SAM-dependent methyltransferase